MNLNTDKLLILIAEQCMNPYDLCEKADISYIVYHKTVTGKSKPKPATVGKIAKALNVSVKELLED